MSKYLLYGEKIINKDDTFKDFAKSVISNCPAISETEVIEDILLFKRDEIIEQAQEILLDDVSRTDINYEELMYKYRSEIGEILYEMDNHDYPMNTLCFFGEGAKESFETLCNSYNELFFTELVNEIKTMSV